MDRRAILAETKIRESELEDPWSEITERQEVDLWSALAVRVSDPLIGIHFGNALTSAERFGVVGFLARSGSTWDDALTDLVRYHLLLGTEHAELRRDEGTVTLTFEMSRTLLALRHPGEARLASMLTGWRHAIGASDRPLMVTVPHAAPSDEREYADLLDAPVTFGATTYGIVWARGQVTRSHLAKDSQAHRFFEHVANQALERAGPRALEQQVRDALLRDLDRGPPTLRAVAHRLAVSSRTLQRRLGDAALSFSGLVDQVRQRRALTLLETSDRTLMEIASDVGFQDVSALRRACHRWVGVSPAEVRARARKSKPRRGRGDPT